MDPCPKGSNANWYYAPKGDCCEIQRAAAHHAKWEEAKPEEGGFRVPVHAPSSYDLYRAAYDRIFGRKSH